MHCNEILFSHTARRPIAKAVCIQEAGTEHFHFEWPIETMIVRGEAKPLPDSVTVRAIVHIVSGEIIAIHALEEIYYPTEHES